MSSGFTFLQRETPHFPDNKQLIDIAKWNREHGSSKLDHDRNLGELDKLRRRAAKGGLW